VSTNRQADEGESLDTQKRTLEGYAMMLDLRIDRVFVERGVSGSKPLGERPEGAALLCVLQPGDRPATVPCDVQVFPLAVRRQLKNWPEANQQTTRWFSAAEAAAFVTDDGLSPLILQLEQQKRAPRRKSEGARRE